MSTSQFPNYCGKFKKGNGVEYLMHQEKVAQKHNVHHMRATMDTRGNIYYTRMRDDIEKQFKKMHNDKIKILEQ